MRAVLAIPILLASTSVRANDLDEAIARELCGSKLDANGYLAPCSRDAPTPVVAAVDTEPPPTPPPAAQPDVRGLGKPQRIHGVVPSEVIRVGVTVGVHHREP